MDSMSQITVKLWALTAFFLQTDITEIPLSFTVAMSSVMSERLLLNIRGRYDMEPSSIVEGQLMMPSKD